MNAVPYCELVNFPDQPAPEREIMPSAPEINDVDIPIDQNRNPENLGNRASENIPDIITPENQLRDQELSIPSVIWSLLLIIWIGSHISLLLLVLFDTELSEGIKIWTSIICVVETVLISITVVFRNVIIMLVCIYCVEFIVTTILMVVYSTETIALDLLVFLSAIKLFLSCHKFRVEE